MVTYLLIHVPVKLQGSYMRGVTVDVLQSHDLSRHRIIHIRLVFEVVAEDFIDMIPEQAIQLMSKWNSPVV